MRNLYARMRAIDSRTADLGLAVLLTAAGLLEAILIADGDTGDLIGGLIAAGGIIALAWRRSRPLIPTLVIPLTTTVGAVVAPSVLNNDTSPFLAMMILTYSLGRYAEPRLAKLGVIGVLVTIGIVTLGLDGFDHPAQIVWTFVLGGGPYAAGMAMANRTRLRADLLARTEELERDRERQARRAVEDERTRIAEELQVVVANGVSAMVLQAEAVPRVLAAGNEASAAHALEVIEETGRDALAEMRRLLGVLRREGEAPALAPLPTLSEAGRLAEQKTSEGLEVELAVEGERVELAAGADLAAYRVLQEALDAAAEGGARKASVTLGYDADELRLDVRDDRAELAVDQGPLIAMRDRLGLYGGRVRAGGSEDGEGFRVLARLPLDRGGR